MSTSTPDFASLPPTLATRIAAVVVVAALVALAAFAVFAAPTRVPAAAGTQVTHTVTNIVPSGRGEPADSGGD